MTKISNAYNAFIIKHYQKGFLKIRNVLILIGKLFVLTCCFVGITFAGDPILVTKSARPLLDALRSHGDEYVIPQINAAYIPDYGLQVLVTFVRPFDEIDPEILKVLLKSLLESAASSIEGLGQDDWVSIALNAQPPAEYFVVRLRPNNPESLEVWVNGQRLE